MRVLHFFKSYWPDTFGGVERAIHALAKNGSAYGIDSTVLSLSRRPAENTRSFDGHMAYKARLDLDLASTGLSWSALGRFRELSAEADLIHYHFPWPFMDLAHFLCRHGKPSIVTYHSDIVKQRWLLHAYKPLMSRFLDATDAIIATSPNYAMSSAVLRAHASKTHVIPLGLGEEDYPPPPRERIEGWRQRFPRPFFLFVGVLRYYKGLHNLIDAAKMVDADILVLGAGPMEGQLRARAEQAGCANVHFLGALPDEDKSALLTLCRGFLLPSHLRSEAFGLSLVEAAMAARPLISCEIATGTTYINLDGVTGRAVPPERPTELAAAMREMLEDPQQAAAWGYNARKRYEELFRVDTMTNAYATLYRKVLADHGRPH